MELAEGEVPVHSISIVHHGSMWTMQISTIQSTPVHDSLQTGFIVHSLRSDLCVGAEADCSSDFTLRLLRLHLRFAGKLTAPLRFTLHLLCVCEP